MPYHIKAEQQKFSWTLINDLPVGECDKWGQGVYLLCCPLCGRLHNLKASIKLTSTGTLYEPSCLKNPATTAWIKQHPEAANRTSVFLKLRQPARIVPAEIEKSGVERKAA